MLKLYMKTIVACICGTILSVFVSALCLSSSHELAPYIQNYAIGMACSLVVVILTSWLQYQHEYKNAYADYCQSIYNVISALSIICLLDKNKTDEDDYKTICKHTLDIFKNFLDSDKNLIFLSQKKRKQRENISKEYSKIIKRFLKKYLNSEKDAVLTIATYDEVLNLISISENIIESSLQKELINTNKKTLTFIRNRNATACDKKIKEEPQ